jgi:hypothetical protein
MRNADNAAGALPDGPLPVMAVRSTATSTVKLASVCGVALEGRINTGAEPTMGGAWASVHHAKTALRITMDKATAVRPPKIRMNSPIN